MGYKPTTHELTQTIMEVPEATDCLKQLTEQQKDAMAAIKRALWRMMKMQHAKWTLFKKGGRVWLDARNIDDPLLLAKMKPR